MTTDKDALRAAREWVEGNCDGAATKGCACGDCVYKEMIRKTLLDALATQPAPIEGIDKVSIMSALSAFEEMRGKIRPSWMHVEKQETIVKVLQAARREHERGGG